MLSYISKRLLQAVPVLIGVSILVFLLIHLIPGDPVLVMLQGSPNVTPELIAEVAMPALANQFTPLDTRNVHPGLPME